MPIVNIYMYEGRSVDQKRKLAAEVTDAICRALDVGPR
jgi:4-oxalocrotonate tautomerase